MHIRVLLQINVYLEIPIQLNLNHQHHYIIDIQFTRNTKSRQNECVNQGSCRFFCLLTFSTAVTFLLIYCTVSHIQLMYLVTKPLVLVWIQWKFAQTHRWYGSLQHICFRNHHHCWKKIREFQHLHMYGRPLWWVHSRLRY